MTITRGLSDDHLRKGTEEEYIVLPGFNTCIDTMVRHVPYVKIEKEK